MIIRNLKAVISNQQQNRVRTAISREKSGKKKREYRGYDITDRIQAVLQLSPRDL